MAATSSRLPGAALGMVLLLLPGSAVGAGPESSAGAEEAERRRLEQVRREIDRLQSSLHAAKQEESTLLGELHRLDMELDLQRRQLQLLEGETVRCREEIERKSLEVAQIRDRLGRQREVLAARVRGLYVSGPLRLERVALEARSPAEAAEAYRLASRVAEEDGRRIRGFRADLSALQDSIASLESRKTQLASLKIQEAGRRRDLEGVRAERSRLLGGVRQRTEEGEEALKEMMETERDLQRLIQALLSGESVRPEWKVGFERFRGLLPWPAPGRVLVPFGARKNARFDTRVPHPGIDLETPVGEPVRAVFDGSVAFSDWFKGFGNLIVLDHGGGFMTVYAHASERLVSRGDRVLEGQVIARSGDTGSLEGPKLYFEIWRDGKPEDPVPWLARR